MLSFSKNKSAEKDTRKNASNIELVDMHCRVMTDLLSDNNDDAVQSWRIFRIMSEFVDGFELLRKYRTAVTFMGSARTTPDNQYYQEAKELSGLLAQSGFAVITGGGAGIMEAANDGACEVGGQSVGLNIELEEGQSINPHVTESKTFYFFFSRKVMLAFASEVYIFFPGGFGTLDEFFEILTLVQTQKISKIPIVLYGKDFWDPVIDFMEEKLLAQYETISAQDMKLFHLVDSIEEAYAYVTKNIDPCAPRQV